MSSKSEWDGGEEYTGDGGECGSGCEDLCRGCGHSHREHRRTFGCFYISPSVICCPCMRVNGDLHDDDEG